MQEIKVLVCHYHHAYDEKVLHQCHMGKHHRPALMVSCHHSELKEKRIVINFLPYNASECSEDQFQQLFLLHSSECNGASDVDR